MELPSFDLGTSRMRSARYYVKNSPVSLTFMIPHVVWDTTLESPFASGKRSPLTSTN